MALRKSQLVILGIVGLVIIFVILLLSGVLPGSRPLAPAKVTLTFWGLKSDEPAMRGAVEGYTQLNKNITIEYTGFPDYDYEDSLLDALAAGNGPDIFFIRNDWVQKHKNKILPAPSELVSSATVEELYPSVVKQDLVLGGDVYGLPLSIDSLALIYNRGIFDLKQIAVPPTTWDGIRAVVPKVREISAGKLTRGGIAMGSTDRSVVNSTDILSLIMMEMGADMTNPQGSLATFSDHNGLQALKFYADFADPTSPNYAWNDSFGNSLDAFANGRVAMAFLYANQVSEVKAKNTLLKYGVLYFPQFNLDNPLNTPKFWSMVVSNRTGNYAESWNLINYLATDESTASIYASSSENPPALRELMDTYRQNPEFKVFVSQALISIDWPIPDHAGVTRAFNNMIESYLADKSLAEKAMKTAQEEVNRLINKNNSRPQ